MAQIGRKYGATSEESQYIEKVLTINRVSKVTKGGKRLSFSALVIVGDGQGKVSYALGKANEVADAIRKGLSHARTTMVSIPLKGTTIPHDVIGDYGAAKVLLRPASEGTGVIASGPVRAICECAGIKDILTKCLASNNPINVIKATMKGFGQLRSEPLTISEEDEPQPDTKA